MFYSDSVGIQMLDPLNFTAIIYFRSFNVIKLWIVAQNKIKYNKMKTNKPCMLNIVIK